MDDNDFLFIEETGVGHKAATKSRIKMHVMDRVVKQKRTRKHERRQGRRLESKDFRGNHMHTSYAGNLEFLTGIDDMVRLAGLPISIGNTDAKFILHHFLNTHSPLMCTIASETGWLKYALEDGALFNSTLYYWALLNFHRLPVKFLNEQCVMRLKGLAISKINPRLNASDHCGVDDAVIASVACLANVNLKIGNLEEATIHFRGLVAMIRGRRGLHTLGYEGLIARLLRATDNFHAQLSGTNLSFEDPTDNHRRINSNSHLGSPSHGFVANLRAISAQLIASPKEGMSLEERVRIGQQLLASDQEILRYIHHTAPSISTVVATGALLYSHMFLRGMERSYPLVKAVVAQVKVLITSAYSFRGDIFDENPVDLVWVLFVGALASEAGSPDRVWFKGCLEKACEGDSQRIMECLEILINTEHHGTPQAFYWMLQDSWIELSSVNTKIF